MSYIKIRFTSYPQPRSTHCRYKGSVSVQQSNIAMEKIMFQYRRKNIQVVDIHCYVPLPEFGSSSFSTVKSTQNSRGISAVGPVCIPKKNLVSFGSTSTGDPFSTDMASCTGCGQHLCVPHATRAQRQVWSVLQISSFSDASKYRFIIYRMTRIFNDNLRNQ